MMRQKIKLKEKLLDADPEFGSVRLFESPYEARDFLINCDAPQRVFIDKKESIYLVGLVWGITHIELVDIANKNGYYLKFDDFDKDKLCIIFVPKYDSDAIETIQNAIEYDDYDSIYDYDDFTVCSRYHDFSKYELSKLLGSYEKMSPKEWLKVNK